MSDRIPHAEMADEMAKLIYGKTCWLADFTQCPRKRPEHEIERVQREKRVLQQAHDDYRRAAEKERNAA